MDYYLHTASRYIVNLLVSNQISLLVIGQNFVNIPHSRFIEQLTYKCQLVGIEVKTVNESYTSKCSFLDLEPIQKQSKYAGKRVKEVCSEPCTSKSVQRNLWSYLSIEFHTIRICHSTPSQINSDWL